MKFVSDPVCHCDHLFYDKNDKLKNSYSTHFGIGFSKKRIKIDKLLCSVNGFSLLLWRKQGYREVCIKSVNLANIGAQALSTWLL